MAPTRPPCSTSRSACQALLALVLATSACTDRVTAPQAVAMLRAIDQPYAVDSASYEVRFWEDLGNWSGLMQQLQRVPAVLPSVDVMRDAQPVRYTALVIERLLEPADALPAAAACLTPRRTLLLWRAGELDAIVMMGGDYHQRVVARPDYCVGVPGPQPFGWAGRILHARTPEEQRMWWGTADGAGVISPGVDAGTCRFLHPRDAKYLLAEHGITCRRTRHQVHFAVAMRPLPYDRRSNARAPGFSWSVEAVDVVGIRFTVDCTLEAAEPACFGHLRSADRPAYDDQGVAGSP